MKELQIKVVFKLLTESKNHLSDLRGSVGPVTSESLDRLNIYLKDFEEEVATLSQQKRMMRKVVLIVSLGLLLASNMLLIELVPQVINLISQTLLK